MRTALSRTEINRLMASSNKFINQGIEIVKEAIRLDNQQDYEQAYGKYKSSLNYFMTGWCALDVGK